MTIIEASAKKLGVDIDDEGAKELASRSRGTPRIANRFLKRVRDFAQIQFDGKINEEVAKKALGLMDVDAAGLDRVDREFLKAMINIYGGGPVGLKAVASSIGEDAGTLEDVYEPFLVQSGYIKRTPQGRMVTELAYQHLGL